MAKSVILKIISYEESVVIRQIFEQSSILVGVRVTAEPFDLRVEIS
jgi:hypothetical protein